MKFTRRTSTGPLPRGWLWIQGTDQIEFAPIRKWREQRAYARYRRGRLIEPDSQALRDRWTELEKDPSRPKFYDTPPWLEKMEKSNDS
jgi:hypothetical protein